MKDNRARAEEMVAVVATVLRVHVDGNVIHKELAGKIVSALLSAEAREENKLSRCVDAINHPPHYNAHPSGVECITVTEHCNFNIGNAIKYLWRAGLKNPTQPVEDLKKAEWYVRREIDRLNKLTTTSTTTSTTTDNKGDTE